MLDESFTPTAANDPSCVTTPGAPVESQILFLGRPRTVGRGVPVKSYCHRFSVLCGDELVEGPVAFTAGKSIVAKLKSNDRTGRKSTHESSTRDFLFTTQIRMKNFAPINLPSFSVVPPRVGCVLWFSVHQRWVCVYPIPPLNSVIVLSTSAIMSSISTCKTPHCRESGMDSCSSAPTYRLFTCLISFLNSTKFF